jgi:hypothetical protein
LWFAKELKLDSDCIIRREAVTPQIKFMITPHSRV